MKYSKANLSIVMHGFPESWAKSTWLSQRKEAQIKVHVEAQGKFMNGFIYRTIQESIQLYAKRSKSLQMNGNAHKLPFYQGHLATAFIQGIVSDG